MRTRTQRYLVLLLLVAALTSVFAPAAAHAQPAVPDQPGDLDQLWLEAVQTMAAALPGTMPVTVAAATPADLPTASQLQEPSTATFDDLRATQPLFSDDFSEAGGQWSHCEDDIIACVHRDGAYVLVAPLSLRGASTLDVDVDNFLYEVDARWYDKAEYSFVAGLLFRYTDEDNYYRFEVQSDGQYLLMKRVDGESEIVVEPTESPLLQTGSDFASRLGVVAVGPSISLLIDGQVVQQVEDDVLSHGGIGLYVRAPDRTCSGFGCITPSGIAIAFDNLALWPVAGQAPAPEQVPAPTATATPAPVTLESLNIDWAPLVEEFIITNMRLEELLEANMAVPVTYVIFNFEAARDVGQVAYTAAFINDQGKVKNASVVLFEPDMHQSASSFDMLGGWNAGLRGTARFALPERVDKYVTVRLVRNR